MNSKTELGSKTEWRSEMRRRLTVVTSESDAIKARREERVVESLQKILSAHPGLWFSFAPTREEPLPPQSVNGVEFAYPVTTSAATTMKFYSAGARAGKFSLGRFGLREPDLSDASWREVSISEARGALVPGLGFDRHLRRLGRGAGFYDRFLKDSTFLKVGVAFREQLADELPYEPHDVGLDGLVTDNEIIWKVSI